MTPDRMAPASVHRDRTAVLARAVGGFPVL